MRFSAVLIVLAASARLVDAFPHMMGAGFSAPNFSPNMGLVERDAITNITGIVKGLLGGVAQSVNPSDKRPDAAHPFVAPGPTDQRGPCPGLNLLANHGYLPHNGIVTAGAVIEAVSEGFNMGVDLSSLLVYIAVAYTGNIVTQTFSIGGEDNRTYSPTGFGSRAAGRQFGLDAHSRCEADVSTTRGDFFTNNGDNHSGIGSRFARLVKLAAANGGQFSVTALNQMYGQNAAISVAQNPKLFANSYTILVILGEYPFYPNFFSNGTYGAGGTANYDSISSIVGFKFNEQNGTFCYVPERYPENWYRRSTEYGFAQFAANLLPTYVYGPQVVNPLGAAFNPSELNNLGCTIYQGITSGVYASLVGEANDKIEATITYLQQKLLPHFSTPYGCVVSNSSSSHPVFQDSLQATGPGGEQKYNTCSA